MKKLLLITITIFTINVNGQSKNELCKKWYLKGYVYLGVTFSPEEKEKNDYLHLKLDNTFTNIDEGLTGKGTWRWDMKNKIIYLSDKSSKESLSMNIVQLFDSQLIVSLKNAKDSIKIKFTAKK